MTKNGAPNFVVSNLILDKFFLQRRGGMRVTPPITWSRHPLDLVGHLNVNHGEMPKETWARRTNQIVSTICTPHPCDRPVQFSTLICDWPLSSARSVTRREMERPYGCSQNSECPSLGMKSIPSMG